MIKILKPLAIEARNYGSGKEFEIALNKEIKEGKGNMFSGVYIGNAIYNYNIAMALDREGYTNIIDVYNDAIK